VREGLLSGKVGFVSGGARGIGLAVAERFVEEGGSVAIGDVLIAEAERKASLLGGQGQAVAVEVDVTNELALAGAVEATVQAFGRVDCVVANAGVLALKHAVDLGTDEWKRVVDINLTGSFLTCRAFAERLLHQNEGGSIILTSSLFGLRGGVENSAYSAAKFGMIGLMQSLAAELAPHRITVNAVCPGQIQTEMMDKLLHDRSVLTGRTEDEIRASLESRVAMGRLGTMREVADVYVFLASDLSRYVTGQSIVVDGGWQVG
jgi:NAD(P)-dependent dehydrogenase (short-subunit alcohol dehydrogenase family)